MENTEPGSRRGIPRLSRLPVPRSALSTSVSGNKNDLSTSTSQIPKLSGNRAFGGQTRPLLVNAGENVAAASSQDSGHPAQQHPSFIDHLEPINPLSSSNEVRGGETNVPRTPDGTKQKRRPRPSLSERTVETLSLLTPSPSPSRRRVGTMDGNSDMAPPPIPMAAIRPSQHNSNLRTRLTPTPNQLRSSYAHDGPLNQHTTLLPSPRHHSIPTPSKIAPRIAKADMAKPYQADVPAAKNSTYRMGTPAGLSNSISSPSRMRSLQQLRTSTSKPLPPRPSSVTPAQNLTQPNSRIHETGQSSLPSTKGIGMASQLKKPCLSSSVKPTTTLPRPSHNRAVVTTSIESGQSNVGQSRASIGNVSKSSLTLRETIAKAKAAKSKAQENPTGLRDHHGQDSASVKQSEFEHDSGVDVSKTLRNRIESAVASGTLNIAGLRLTSLPDEILSMYDFEAGSKVNWAEAVDMVKFSAADNELQYLPETFFPDWSEEQLHEDDDKVNQFGGLQVLDFHGNRLSTLPEGFRRLGHLRTLILTNNQLGLDSLQIISQLTQLRELHLASNNLEGAISPSIGQLVALEVLNLQSNRISTMPDSILDMKHLQILDLSKNRLKTIPTGCVHNTSLIELNISQNMLSGTLFADGFCNPRLQALNLASNDIRLLCGTGLDLPKLHTLICDNNTLSSLPSLIPLRSLATLSASGNKITDLPLGFTEAEILHNVDLGANQIKALPSLIARMESLTVLNVAANPLRERKYLAMNTAQLKTELGKRLEIDTDDMMIPDGHRTSVTSPTSNTVLVTKVQPVNGVLNLSSKKFRSVDLDKIDLTQCIHAVDLSENDLIGFPEELLAHPMVKSTLRQLNISQNASLHPTEYLLCHLSLPVLESLHVTNTGMQKLDALVGYLHAPLLKELNISRQRVSGPLPQLTKNFPYLTTLFAADNRFDSISTEALRNLEVVDIRNNNIEHLPPKIGELGNIETTAAKPGRLRAFECSGNKFRVPRVAILERGTEAVLRDLRRMIPSDQIGDEWQA